MLSDTTRSALTEAQCARVERLLELSARHEPIIRLRRLLRTTTGVVLLEVMSELLDRQRVHVLRTDGATVPMGRRGVGPLECLQEFKW